MAEAAATPRVEDPVSSKFALRFSSPRANTRMLLGFPVCERGWSASDEVSSEYERISAFGRRSVVDSDTFEHRPWFSNPSSRMLDKRTSVGPSVTAIRCLWKFLEAPGFREDDR